ncbi:MAG: aminodeoxychorismate/anthranilate synthase component II [Deltaproteobacteria bacterium]|nr:aminodeoxychorismate/anthranilate synthase component II [Deltaproteobacteria bacterium]
MNIAKTKSNFNLTRRLPDKIRQSPRLLVIDNYDSFTYNLVQMFILHDLLIQVSRSDRISIQEINIFAPDYILISPGPKDPAHSGLSMEVINAFLGKVPILGVCLGMQCINEVFGGKTVRSQKPVHGKTSKIYHEGFGIFKDVPSPFIAARYHSLVVEKRDKELIITARCADGVAMGISHPSLPLHGVQFHPESFLTEHGHLIIENFLKLGPADV